MNSNHGEIINKAGSRAQGTGTNERIKKIDQALCSHSIILFKIETCSLHELEQNQELFKTEGCARRLKEDFEMMLMIKNDREGWWYI